MNAERKVDILIHQLKNLLAFMEEDNVTSGNTIKPSEISTLPGDTEPTQPKPTLPDPKAPPVGPTPSSWRAFDPEDFETYAQTLIELWFIDRELARAYANLAMFRRAKGNK